MDSKSLKYFKERLIGEKGRVKDTLKLMEKNQTIKSNAEMASELSFYDNHPADLGEEISDIEKGRALQQNEISIIRKIDDSLQNIEDGTYGICKNCGKSIPRERLEFIPYASFCVKCQTEINNKTPLDRKDRPVEEEVLKKPFSFSFSDFESEDDVGFDAEDSLQAVFRMNKMHKSPDNYDDDEDEDASYVEPIEKISNEQYKDQLPD